MFECRHEILTHRPFFILLSHLGEFVDGFDAEQSTQQYFGAPSLSLVIEFRVNLRGDWRFDAVEVELIS